MMKAAREIIRRLPQASLQTKPACAGTLLLKTVFCKYNYIQSKFMGDDAYTLLLAPSSNVRFDQPERSIKADGGHPPSSAAAAQALSGARFGWISVAAWSFKSPHSDDCGQLLHSAHQLPASQRQVNSKDLLPST